MTFWQWVGVCGFMAGAVGLGWAMGRMPAPVDPGWLRVSVRFWVSVGVLVVASGGLAAAATVR